MNVMRVKTNVTAYYIDYERCHCCLIHEESRDRMREYDVDCSLLSAMQAVPNE